MDSRQLKMTDDRLQKLSMVWVLCYWKMYRFHKYENRREWGSRHAVCS